MQPVVLFQRDNEDFVASFVTNADEFVRNISVTMAKIATAGNDGALVILDKLRTNTHIIISASIMQSPPRHHQLSSPLLSSRGWQGLVAACYSY
jgi:hypothetical protein